jgi:hypothetical protein
MKTYIDRANESLKNANELKIHGIWLICKGDYSANNILRKALGEYLTAYYIFDDADLKKDIFTEMCRLGKLLHDLFRCPIEYNGRDYIKDCPIILSQIDMGISIECEESYICSICGKDPLYCDHISWKKYDNVLCQRIIGNCNICLSSGECEHVPGQYYDNVYMVRIVTDMKINALAFTRNPADKLARIIGVPISKSDIEQMLQQYPEKYDNKFEYGVSKLYCHKCNEKWSMFHELAPKLLDRRTWNILGKWANYR